MGGFLPDTMRVIEIAEPGGPDNLVPATRPLVRPGPGEVLIRVAAAGVNRPDVLQRQGAYPAPKGHSDIPGLEVAGTVAAVGSGVEWPRVGEEVCALVNGGGYAEYCLAPAPQCLPVPVGLDMAAAAGLPETFFTVWTNVFARAGLENGETFLVHGGTSGIGTTAIQLAAEFGARVFTTCGSAEKCAFAETLGAERAVNYKTEDFLAVFKELTNDRGIDVILDMVGGDYIPKNVRLLAREGRLVSIAFIKGPKAEVNFLPVMLKRLTITGSTLRVRSVEEKGAIAQALRKRVWPLIEAERIKPVVHATLPLAQTADAHRMMERGEHIGKIILTA